MDPAKEALLEQLESDLVHVHRQRMSERKAALFQELQAERGRPSPDEDRISQLSREMLQAERDKLDVSITEREVLEPLRTQLRHERECASGKPPRAIR